MALGLLVFVLLLGEIAVELIEVAVELAEVVRGELLELVQAPTNRIVAPRRRS